MSELINTNDDRATIRWKLLTSASALVLTAYVSATGLAQAEDSDRPQIWIELGGQLNRLQDNQEIFTPPFVALTPPGFSPPQEAERPPLYGIDETGKISFQPESSDWIFSASIRYGRASSSKQTRHQSYPGAYIQHSKLIRGTFERSFSHPSYPIAARFTDARVKDTEDHTILDFQAGKDLGLGLFGRDASSSLSAGVRIAQFKSKSRATLEEDPDWRFAPHHSSFDFQTYYGTRIITHRGGIQLYHSFEGVFRADRSFKGLGPSISWTSSVPFAGNSHDGELTFDWGVNAALLFGRQKTKAHHQTTGRYHSPGTNLRNLHNTASLITTYQRPATPDHTRSRNVTVPNVGGSVGLSWQLQDFKMSFGYRADFFFGAIDGGIDARKNESRAFYGPYASISIGLGD